MQPDHLKTLAGGLLSAEALAAIDGADPRAPTSTPEDVIIAKCVGDSTVDTAKFFNSYMSLWYFQEAA